MFDALLLRVGGRLRHSSVPVEIITGTGEDARPRVRVDPGQTAFWEGRMHRFWHEFSIASGESLWVRFTNPADAIMHDQHLSVMEGKLRFALGYGGTPGGTWTDKAVYPLNGMQNRPTPVPSQDVVIAVGGTNTGMTEVDVSLIEVGTSANAVAAEYTSGEAGFGAGVYYAELRNTGNSAVRGVYKAVWEEWKSRSTEVQ